MKQLILLLGLILNVHVCFSQQYTSEDDKKAKDWGFDSLKPADNYQLGLKKGQDDFVVRNFLQGYKYFICIKSQDGVKDVDAWLINKDDDTEIVGNTERGNKIVYFKFTPNYSRDVKIKVMNYDCDNPDNPYNFKIWVFYENIN